MHVLSFLAKLEHFTHVGRSFIHTRHIHQRWHTSLGNPRMVHPGQIPSRRLQTKYLNTCLIFSSDWMIFGFAMMSEIGSSQQPGTQGHQQMGFPDRFTLCGVATAAVALFRPRAEPLALAETGGCETIIPKWPLQ